MTTAWVTWRTNCPSASNSGQENTARSWQDLRRGTLVPVISRDAKPEETFAKVYPGDACRIQVEVAATHVADQFQPTRLVSGSSVSANNTISLAPKAVNYGDAWGYTEARFCDCKQNKDCINCNGDPACLKRVGSCVPGDPRHVDDNWKAMTLATPSTRQVITAVENQNQTSGLFPMDYPSGGSDLSVSWDYGRM